MIFVFFYKIIGTGRGSGGHGPSKCLAYLVILCFEKRRSKQKYCCLPKIKHFGPPKFGLATPLYRIIFGIWPPHFFSGWKAFQKDFPKHKMCFSH